MTARGISSAQPLATHNQTKNASQHSQNHASGQARKNSAVYVSLSSDKLVKQQHLKRIKILKTHRLIQTSIPAHSSAPKSQNQNRTKLIKRPYEPHVHIRRNPPQCLITTSLRPIFKSTPEPRSRPHNSRHPTHSPDQNSTARKQSQTPIKTPASTQTPNSQSDLQTIPQIKIRKTNLKSDQT